jgi:hypothetical protein
MIGRHAGMTMSNQIQAYSLHEAPTAAQVAFKALKPVFQQLPNITCWIAGGCVRDLCLYGYHNTDIDVLFPNAGEVSDARPLILGITAEGITENVSSATSKLVLDSGCVRDLCLYGYHNTDIDVLFPNAGEVSDARPLILGITAEGITENVSSATSKLVLDSGIVYKYETPLGKIDLLRRNFPNPSAAIDSFDFTVACAAFDREGNFYCHARFWQDLEARQLVCHTLSHPMSTLRRLEKYTQKGFSASPKELLKLGQAIQEAGDLSKQVLGDY